MAGFVMARLTHVPSVVAALPMATALPGVIFALPAGAVSDAADRRLVLLSPKTLVFFCTFGLALRRGHLGPELRRLRPWPHGARRTSALGMYP